MFRIIINDFCGEKYLHIVQVETQMRTMYGSFCRYYGQTAAIFVLNEKNEIILKNS